MSHPPKPTQLDPETQEVVDLVSAVLVDPNLHTDLRMRLQEEITELLRSAHESSHAAGPGPAHQAARKADGDQLPQLLQAVLSDPNLHTDLRMRLYREIPELLSQAEESAGRRQ